MRQLYLALAMCAAALPAHAQEQPQGATSPGAQQQQQQQQQASPMTQQFVSKAATGDLYEIQASQMVLDKSLGGEFQTFAERVVDDHTNSGNKLKTLANNMGIQIPAQLDARHRAMIEQLQAASGPQFASMYKAQQIDAHNEAVQLYEQYSQQGDNVELRQFVEATIPALRTHLQLAQNLPQEPGGMVSQAPGMKMGQPMGQQMNQQKQASQTGEKKIIGSLGPEHVLASDLNDTDVYSAAGEEIGEVSDVVLNRNGETVAIVVGVGGFLGLGEKNVAIPFTAVEISTSGNADRAASEPALPNRIILRGMTRDELEAAPSFEND